MKDLVSCIVPTRNGEKFLAQTLESILAQTYRPIELIVVDDGSVDRSREIAAGFGDAVRLIAEHGTGPVVARNRGIGAARGEYIAFLDHDDLWVPEKLARQIEAFERNPQLDVSVGLIQRFSDAGPSGQREFHGEAVPGFLTVTMLARRTAFERVGNLNPANFYSDSTEWFLRAKDAGLSVQLLPTVLTYHRDHGGSRSLTHGDESRREFLHLIKATLDQRRRKSALGR